jgi:hypothetical protein
MNLDMNSHHKQLTATRRAKGSSSAAGPGHAWRAWPLSFNVMVVVITVALILLEGSG